MARRALNQGNVYRNRARGLLNEAREHGFGVDDSLRNHRLRVALRLVLLEARLFLPPGRFQENLAWLFNQTELAVKGRPESVGQGLLYQNVYAPTAPLETELRWIAARLVSARETIAQHISVRRAISIAFLAGDREAVGTQLDQIEAAIGDSHWLLALRLATLQAFEGIEAQKAYVAEIRKRSNSGITAAFAFHTSVRNEASVSFPWFTNGIKRRRFSKKHPEHKLYLEFALLGSVPEDVDDVATVLRVEQSHADVDVYEAALSIAQSLSIRRNSDAIRHALSKFVSEMREAFDDPRLEKIAITLDPNCGIRLKPTNETPLAELLCEGASDAPLPSPETCADDPAAIIWSALAAAVQADERPTGDPKTPRDNIYNQLIVLAGRMPGFERARENLVKHAKNFSGLSYAKLLGAVCAALSIPTVNELPERLASASVVSHTQGLFESLLARTSGNAYQGDSHTAPEQFIDAFYSGTAALSLTDDAQAVCSIRSSIRNGSSENIYEFLAKGVASSRPFARNWACVASLEVFMANNDLGSSLRLIGSRHAESTTEDAPLPLDTALASFKLASLKRFGAELTTPLALEALRQTTDTAANRSHVRLAYNKYMRQSGFALPSLIPMGVLEANRGLFIAFLKEICVPDFMDMSAGAKSSLNLQEERRRVCALLRQIDPISADYYETEILNITQSLSIWEGLKTVDASRIHVDGAGFARAAGEELKGSFERYASLVRAGVGVSANFDEVVRNLQRDPTFAEGMSIPANEADELLGEMVRRMKTLFLKNSIFGLHGFLSRRIRHGSLIGHLRGPVERHKLITQMSGSTGAYVNNSYWLQRCTPIDGKCRARVERALSEFSRSLDRELLTLKDERLHVKDEEHTSGVFDIFVSAGALVFIRGAIKSDMTLESLVAATATVFWELLNTSLREAERLVKIDFQKKATELFQRLQSTVTPCLAQDAEKAAFTKAVRLATEETQFQVKTVASWFDKSSDGIKLATYTLYDAIEVGVKAAKASIPGFDPYVMKTCDNLDIPSVNIQFVADFVLIALANIHKHSGSGEEPRVDIHAKIGDGRKTLKLSARSAVGEGVRCELAEAKLELIRKNIADRTYEQFVGVEGASGLYKLAALVHQSTVGDITFGFTADGNFELGIELSLILDHPAEPDEGAVGIRA